jgi:hypothetical protein
MASRVIELSDDDSDSPVTIVQSSRPQKADDDWKTDDGTKKGKVRALARIRELLKEYEGTADDDLASHDIQAQIEMLDRQVQLDAELDEMSANEVVDDDQVAAPSSSEDASSPSSSEVSSLSDEDAAPRPKKPRNFADLSKERQEEILEAIARHDERFNKSARKQFEEDWQNLTEEEKAEMQATFVDEGSHDSEEVHEELAEQEAQDKREESDEDEASLEQYARQYRGLKDVPAPEAVASGDKDDKEEIRNFRGGRSEEVEDEERRRENKGDTPPTYEVIYDKNGRATEVYVAHAHLPGKKKVGRDDAGFWSTLEAALASMSEEAVQKAKFAARGDVREEAWARNQSTSELYKKYAKEKARRALAEKRKKEAESSSSSSSSAAAATAEPPLQRLRAADSSSSSTATASRAPLRRLRQHRSGSDSEEESPSVYRAIAKGGK